MKINTNPPTVGTVKELVHVSVELKAEQNLQIKYSLMKAECFQSVYFVILTREEECSTVFAGNDEYNAIRLFESLAKGEVTPCTAEYISKDFLQTLCEGK